MRLRDRARIELAVQRLSWWLDVRHLPGRQRREATRELRANLADAAAAHDLDAALARLGPPRALARAYLDHDRPGVRWRTGLVAAAVAVGLITWLLLAYTLGFADGAQAVGPEVGVTYESGSALVPGDEPLASFEQLPDGVAVSGALLAWPQLVAAAVTFVVVARPWRARRRRVPASQAA